MPLHDWTLSPTEAVSLQRQLAAGVVVQDQPGPVRTVAGLDAGYRDGLTTATVALMRYPELELLETHRLQQPTDFPYVPGLLSFREVPALLRVMERLSLRPDLVLCDGQGLAHPRRLGLACHLGLWLDLPTVGVAKSRLVGQYEEPGLERGATSPLVYKGDTVGAVLRTRSKVRPVFVSVGHRVCLKTAIEMVLSCAPRYRLCEPIRIADRLTRGADRGRIRVRPATTG
jgi:deoxyribonuclease V